MVLLTVGNSPVVNMIMDDGNQGLGIQINGLPEADPPVVNHIQIGQVLINAQFHIPEDTLSSNFSYFKDIATSFILPDVMYPTKMTGEITSPLLNLNDGMGQDFGPVFQPNKPSPDVFRL